MSRLDKLYAKVARHRSEGHTYINVAVLPIPIEVVMKNKNLRAVYWVIDLTEAIRSLDDKVDDPVYLNSLLNQLN